MSQLSWQRAGSHLETPVVDRGVRYVVKPTSAVVGAPLALHEYAKFGLRRSALVDSYEAGEELAVAWSAGS